MKTCLVLNNITVFQNVYQSQNLWCGYSFWEPQHRVWFGWVDRRYCRERRQYSPFNPFPHIDTFWCLCSRQFFENMAKKKKLLKMSNFSFCHLYLMIVLSFRGSFHFVWGMFSKSSAADLLWQFCSRRLWTYFVNKWKISVIEWITYD